MKKRALDVFGLVVVVGFIAMQIDFYFAFDGNFSMVCAIAAAAACIVYVLDDGRSGAAVREDDTRESRDSQAP